MAESGIMIEVNDVNLQNTPSSIFINESGITIEVSGSKEQNTVSSICMTE